MVPEHLSNWPMNWTYPPLSPPPLSCLPRASQVHREFRKPLIIVAPKRLLRLKAACSDLSAMGQDTMFMRVIPEVSDCEHDGMY